MRKTKPLPPDPFVEDEPSKKRAERVLRPAPVAHEDALRIRLRKKFRAVLRARVVMRVLKDPLTALDPRPLSDVIERAVAQEVERHVNIEVEARRRDQLEAGVGPRCPSYVLGDRHAHLCARRTGHLALHRCKICGIRWSDKDQGK